MVKGSPAREEMALSQDLPDEASSSTRALHRATLSLFTDLSLDGVLRRIVQAAMDLVQARYAALGIPDGQGGLETFIALGISDEERQLIPHPPQGKGLLGEMLRNHASIRIPVISEDPKSTGFPDGHPPMRSFLGVPISAYGRPLGQLYLTDKLTGDSFSEEDQRLIEMLASHAAAAIENARLYRHVLQSEVELTQRNEELELMNSLASAVSSTMDLESLLGVMLERAMDLFQAESGEVFVVNPSENAVEMLVYRGETHKIFWDFKRFRVGQGFFGKVIETGEAAWTNRLHDELGFAREKVIEAGFNSLVCVPLIARGEVVGALSLALKSERDIDDRSIGLLEAVSAGIGIAVANARFAQQTRRLAILEERERIGMDLHDGIIQSIYAVGLLLDSTRIQVDEEWDEINQRLREAIEGLNAVMRDLRSYILDLRPARIQTEAISESLETLVKEFKANTLVEVDLQIDQEFSESLDTNTSAELFHIAQEALANVAKHAKPSRVLVVLRGLDHHLALQIIDNGKGFDLSQTAGQLGHGLVNMRERAEQMGGELDIISSPGEGTTVTTRLPLSAL